MTYDKKFIGAHAARLGFIRDTFEKMYRLADILADVSSDPTLSDVLALKGGTAINLTIFSLPRLSVDIDFDFIGSVTHDDLDAVKANLLTLINGHMKTRGYLQKIGSSKTTHSLHSLVYEYINAGSNHDNIKIEINYSLRSHILPTEKRKIETLGVFAPLIVHCVAPVEIFAAKISALLTRTAMRDLYDIYNLLISGTFDENQYNILRKCAVFYMAIAGVRNIGLESLKRIDNISYQQVKTDLRPVLRKNDSFRLDAAKKEVKAYLEKLLALSRHERDFLNAFNSYLYKPELLFEGESLENIRCHPMAIWRTTPTHKN